MTNFLIDTHCHLNLGHLKGDEDEIVKRATENGVKYLHTICTRLEEFEEIKSIAYKFPNVYCSVGVHPCNVDETNIPTPENLSKLSKDPKVISFGETGLDYYHPGFDKESQKQSFVNHILASHSEKLPIIVHTREAGDDSIEILTNEMKNNPFTGIIHCFTEEYEFAKKALDLGMYISVAGVVTFKNATKLQETISKLPIDRLLVETDAPYLAPMPMRGKPNEPSYVKFTAGFLSSLLGIPEEIILEETTENAKAIFSKAVFE